MRTNGLETIANCSAQLLAVERELQICLTEANKFLPSGVSPDSPEFWIFLGTAVALVLFAGLMSGLTLGLLSFDEVDLLVLMRSGTETQKRDASRIMSVFRSQHWLLCTLLLCNAAAMEALPIFLNKISNEVVAIAVSVTAVLFFGEIVPQSVCKKFGLAIGSKCAFLVKGLMYITAVISYPLAKILDFVIGADHGGLMKRKQLEALVEFHGHHEGKGGELTIDEVSIIKGALSLSAKPALMSMTPLSIVYMLPSDAVLNRSTMASILDSGYSRVPVHVPHRQQDILGLIIVKELLLLDPDDDTPILSTKVKLYSMPRLAADMPMYDVLNIFQTGKSHMAILTYAGGNKEIDEAMAKLAGIEEEEVEDEDGPLLPHFDQKPRVYYQATGEAGPNAVGIITIEDVLEELIQEEIVDETDKFVDNLHLETADQLKLIRSLNPALQRAIADNETSYMLNIIRQQNELLANQRRIKKQNLRASQQVIEDIYEKQL